MSATSELRATLGDTFTYGEARQASVSDKRLYKLRDAGEIIPLGGGVYRWADAAPADDDLVEIAERVPKATLCLETALARHGLTDAIPAAVGIATPRGSTRPCSGRQCAFTSSTGERSSWSATSWTSVPAGHWGSIRRNGRS